MELYSEKVTLPSGLEVTVREMTTAEEGLMANRKLLKSGEALERILRACVLDKEADTGNLLVGDRYFLLFFIRRLTYGDEYDFKVRCGSCGATFENRIDLGEVPIKRLEGDPDEVRTITLPRSKKLISFRLLRGEDEKRIVKTLKKSPQELVALSLYLHTVKVDGADEFDMSLFEKLSGADSVFYRNKIDEATCGVDTDIDVECPECGNEFEVSLPLNESFFFPAGVKTPS